jgi:hypothetical protein
MTLRNFSSTAAATTLSAGVDGSTTTLAVAGTTGFPAVPFILAVDAGAAAQELVLVTNVAGTNLTVTRGYDSTTAVAHVTGAVVAHSHGGIDFREANTHVNATTGVHGITGAVVGTTDAQALTNKTVALGSNTVSGTKAQFNAALTDADFATQDGVETLTNKTLTAPSVTGGTVTGATLSASSNVFPWVIKSGSGTDTLAAVQTNTQAVAFPSAFASAPNVVASVADERFAVAVKNVTTTGFDLVSYYLLGAPVAGFALGYSWVAVL